MTLDHSPARKSAKGSEGKDYQTVGNRVNHRVAYTAICLSQTPTKFQQRPMKAELEEKTDVDVVEVRCAPAKTDRANLYRMRRPGRVTTAP